MENPLFGNDTDAPALRELERIILQAAAMHYSPVGRMRLADTLRTLGVRTPGGRAAHYPEIKPLILQLLQEGKLEDTGKGLQCPRDQVEALLDQATEDDRLPALAAAVRSNASVSYDWYGQPIYRQYDELIRDLRIALILGNDDLVQDFLAQAFASHMESTVRHPLLQVDSRGHRAPWIQRLPPALHQTILLTLTASALMRMEPIDALQEDLAQTRWISDEWALHARQRRAEFALLAGDTDTALALLGDNEYPSTLTLRAWAALIRGDIDAAREGYAQALTMLRKGSRKRNLYFHDLAGTFSLIPLLATNDLDTAADLATRAIKDRDNTLVGVYQIWPPLIAVRRGQKAAPADDILVSMQPGPIHLLPLLVLFWMGPEQLTPYLAEAESLVHRAQAAGMHWLAAQTRALLNRQRGDAPDPVAEGVALVDLVTRIEPWEATLDALTALGGAPKDADSQTTRDERVVWWLLPYQGQLLIQPKLQRRTRRDGWTLGRNIALSALHTGQQDALDDDDRRVCAAIVEQYPAWGYGASRLEFDPTRAALALVGHPRLFRSDEPSTAVELVAAAPALRVRRSKGRLRMALQPPLPKGGPLRIVEETRNRWQVVRFDDTHRQIGELLDGGLNIPVEAEDRVREAIARIAPRIDIHSDIGGDEDLPRVDGDTTPYLALIPSGDGLTAELRVRPLGSGGSGFTPGHGGAELTAAGADGTRRRVRRNLAQERKQARAVVEACPALEGWEIDPFVWGLPEPQDCLELLEQLQALDGQVTVEWPRGQNLNLSARADGSGFSLSLNHRGDWFEASGELQVNENLVLDLQRLLALLDTGGGSRFLPLGDGRFLALTENFRKRLQDLRDIADSSARKPRYHPLNAPVLEEIANDFGQFQTDDAWHERLQRLRNADASPAAIPATLEAELRDYQVDGYRWLMRLAAWGVGACLADDMGLGKTVQVLAALVARAPLGPSVVIAPTSVCGNWLSEARRFAPTLNPIVFGNGDRQAQIQALGAFDLLIVSYGLMQQEIELLSAREDWNCLVLDEAQAIKNPATQRARAAFGLPAAFRIATTGTPVENHLGELWSLFRFLNPGLLGSREAFNQRYALPIERDQNHEARDRLRRLVRPFILRRLKSAVLEELPPRTEIQLQVDPSPPETAFYEAFRRQILEGLGTEITPAQQDRFEVLAAITRLRRAACHPELVSPGIGIPSGKLALFLEVVEELRDGRHRALVFSQFVDHLNLVRAALDQRGIPYQYLDGSTPASARAERVAAFQGGAGDLFLISLKAGGTGLNLTAADYVIHLDPWWNPAVEDQASDRAHRIGQQRPVTVYRLVMRGSIEERIIDLHARKRDLADTLLEGGDASARLDTEALLALLREERG
ncbi:SNF2-related protein [Thioalkalivibrio nitratireducens DSM 14787]|uniref:SNF2-related protein n=1 Tax=Thioalkalivibrio nitratireducens (strain DSM 14787 / UNIQEM 213 / ALEN2) TaxID=1255043 RepID=L0DZP9_THIND|nr:DEAD/DEAH box helicase [Thioalkalivibrio nitratireducens]AGA34467.1 SNF2-related protein [Thioalkalivibrio nitratireducens DSM 14787]